MIRSKRLKIMMELEDEFGIEISVADVGKTVGSLVEYIDSKKGVIKYA
ncbi:MAG: phosphopantetheine-binding protein [Clostridiales bacterium]|nr:MAG: phosphopantetheine-binding protein [Clostridiales bacterium]